MGLIIMTIGFEQFIFELNEGLQHIGLLKETQYISGFKFIISGVFTVILFIVFDVMVLSNKKYQELIINYMPVFSIVSITLLFLVLKAYILLLVSALFIGFYTIIVCNKKYEWLKEKIEMFF